MIIKHCPFCGMGTGILMMNITRRIIRSAWVECKLCRASGPIIRNITIPPSDEAKEEIIRAAVEGWNRREG